MDKLPNNACILPWIHLHTWPNGTVYQCCYNGMENVIGNLNTNTLEEIWNNDHMRKLRRTMLAGKQHPSCAKCYEQEKFGGTSFRQNSNVKFIHHANRLKKTHKNGTVSDMNFVYWDFRFSNLCNMKCRMCGDTLSSLWGEENIKRSGKTSWNNNTPVLNIVGQNNYKYIDKFINYVEEIYFAGGEPLLMKEHYYILEKLIKLGKTDVKLSYSSNMSKLKNCMDLWKHFKKIHIMASIDAIGPRAEYIRKGTNWDIIVDNLKKVSNQSNIDLDITPTISIFNVQTLPELLDFLYTINPKSIKLNNVLVSPPFFHINTLPDSIKQQTVIRLQNYINDIDNKYSNQLIDDINYIINYIKQIPPRDFTQEFLEYNIELDKWRNENLLDIFPELSSHVKLKKIL